MVQETLSKKKKNMLKAAHLRYVDGFTAQEIADDLGLSVNTVNNYFASDEMEQFKRFFSEEEKRYMKIKVKEKMENNTKLANNLIAQAVKDPDASPRDKIKAAGEAQKLPKRYVDMMQQLGIIEKPKERREVEQKTGTKDLRSELADYYEEKQSVDTEEEEEVESEQ